ncbi:MAG: DNA-processing protein DprA [Candidatus Berkelbacteria bacterium]|nr:DNA-processing protein DprA [Candidatus Berkelbacteria bacterium]MCR4308320.1 DNA-processing protein DprA [Candidatus Berkelbacteria bacterium]
MSTVKRWFLGSTTEDVLSVSMVELLGPASWQKMYMNFESLREVLAASTNLLVRAGLNVHQADAIKSRPTKVEASKHLLTSKKIEIITVDSSDYPVLLKEINDPPLWLFCRGNKKVLKKVCLTVVGTRKPSSYALLAAEKLLPEALVKQLCLVSGLAYGVDKKIHQIALKFNSPTIAVLAGGLDSIYPAEHNLLAEQIVESGGLLITEYPPLSRPRPAKFPIRNRIIAGLSKVTVVLEAAIRSGSLTTAKSALDYNREVMAVPSEITRRDTDGTNFLIKQGATLLDDPAQLFEIYGFKTNKKLDNLDASARELLHLLVKGALSVDQIAQLTATAIPEILGILTELELLGKVFQSRPGFYQARKNA